MKADTLLWTERYRPDDLDQLAMSTDNRALITKSLESGEIPHLLLHGPAGCGKTTLAMIVRDRLDCQPLILNASKDRGIDVIRNRVGSFIGGRFARQWNLVIMDEADFLTTEAQTALRNMMETYSEQARFILTANYPSRIIDPIRSRCVELAMSQMSLRDRTGVLLRVLDSEAVTYEPKDALTYAEAFPDLRRMLTAAQRCVTTHGELRPASTVTAADGETVLQLCLDRDWAAVRETSKEPGTDHAELLRQMFWAVPDDHPRAATLRFTLAEAFDQTPKVPDPVVHFLGTAAHIIDGV